MKKPNIEDRELEKLKSQFDEFDNQVKSLTLEKMNEAPREESEPQTKLSSKEIANAKEVYIKPKRSIRSKEAFNERFREDYEFSKQYVNFIAENRELIGEAIEMWTKPYPGLPAEEWCIPTNKPIWAPRYVAEQIKKKYYHRLKMEENRVTSQDGAGTYVGAMVVNSTIPRLEAFPVGSKRSVFG